MNLSNSPLTISPTISHRIPQLAAASTSVLGASPRGGSPGSLSPRPASPRPLSAREPAPQTAVLPRLPAVSVGAGPGAAASAEEEGDFPGLRHEISLAPSRPAADSPTEGMVYSSPPANTACAPAAAAEQRHEGASSMAASASAGRAGSGAPSSTPVAGPSASVSAAPEDGGTFSAFAAAQAQRGGASAVSLSDTMFASTASTARSGAPDTAARVATQPELGAAVRAGGAAGMSHSAGSPDGGGTGGEQAAAPAEGRGMPPRESMLSATDLVEHGQRAAAAEAPVSDGAPCQSEEAQPPPPAAAVLSTDEAAAAATQPEAAAEEGSGLQPSGDPPPSEVDLSQQNGAAGAATDRQPSAVSLEADAQQPSGGLRSAAAAEILPRRAEANAASLAADTQTSSLQVSDAMQTAAADAAVSPVTAARSGSGASGPASSSAAGQSRNTDVEPVILAIVRPAQMGSASGHSAEPVPPGHRQSEVNTGSVAGADADMRDMPAPSQPVPAAEPGPPMGHGGAELHDRGPAQEARSVIALQASEPRREAAGALGGEQTAAAAATAACDEGDDMLDAQSQHSEGSTVSI